MPSIPRKVLNVADDIGDFTNTLSSQGSRFNSLSGDYRNTANTLNSFAIPNMLKYGEIAESDLLGQATADNTLAYGKAYDAAVRDMTRMGINPNSGRFAGMSQSFALKRAAAEAGARNQARLQARNENFQRANALANLGYNYSGLGLNAANSATSAYNAAAGNQQRYAAALGQIAVSQKA